MSEKGLQGAQVSKRDPAIIWVGYSTCGLSKWSSGLSGCPLTSPPSWEQLANNSTCSETHTHKTGVGEAYVPSHILYSHPPSVRHTHILITSYPSQEPPGPACRLKSPICLFLEGLRGEGRGWNASNRAKGAPLQNLPNYCPSLPPNTPPSNAAAFRN